MTPLRALALLPVVVLVGCGGGGDGSAPDAGRVVSDPGVSHIHGVGMNPADDSVVVATHTGLFRAGPGEQRASRVGDRRQDTMGFTVVGPDRFLGSGHPDARDDRVVVSGERGLAVSRDGGRRWRPLDARRVGLLAWTDQLVLVDGAGDVHASTDDGKSFEKVGSLGAQPAALAAHEDQLLAALHDNTVHVSDDGGRTWKLRVRGS